LKINFKKKTNFYEISSFSKLKKIDAYLILKQAFAQNKLFEDDKEFLNKFINYFKKGMKSESQLFQDIFASFIVSNNFKKTFFEFGATDGVELSNTYSLEKYLGWQGALSEPSPQWHKSLYKNREKSHIIKECIWSKSDESINFFMSDVGMLSTIEDFLNNDIETMPGNTNLRKKNGKYIKVKTITLNKVIEKYFDNISPSYISIDTEGSEYEILKFFDFEKYSPYLFTIEHNFTNNQGKIDELLIKNNYLRVFKDLTYFDAWYIRKDAYNLL
jgi:FkbM family methyltransferase